MKKSFKPVLALFIYGALCFLLFEGIIRIGIFSNYFKLPRLKQADLYAGYPEDDDYWKLYYRFEGESKPPNPKAIHPLLGWSQVWVERDNPLGLSKETLGLMSSDKIKVLFYGDSYVKGAPSSPEYEITKYITKYFQKTVVIDLGCGGYGFDQMFLLFTLTHKKVKSPYVIFGVLLGDDLDRSVLSVRTGQKPYFIVKDDKLLLRGVPIDPDPKRYFDTNPPHIKSYLFRILLCGFLRKTHLFEETRFLKLHDKSKINTKIIGEIQSECKKENYPLLFVLFYGNPLIKTWQEVFIKNKLGQLQISYVDTRDFLLPYALEHKLNINDFYVTEGIGRGHHNDLANKVIAQGLRKYLSETYGLQ